MSRAPNHAPVRGAPSRTARSVAKSAIEQTLIFSGVRRWAAHRHQRDICILAYHNIVPDGDPARPLGDASLHLTLADFRAQLDHLGRYYDVVPLQDTLQDTLQDALAPPRRTARPRVVITFDDAYYGTLVLGVEELAKRGLPATVFVPPGLLGGQALWWDAFAPPDAAADAGLTPAMRREALGGQGGRADRVREWARRAGWVERELPETMRTGTETQLAAASRRHDGLAYGSHTWSHPDLAQLPPGERDAELRTPLAWLRERYRCTIGWLSYPYGLSSEATEQAVRAAGYDAALLVGGGWTGIPPRDRSAIPRSNVPAGISVAGFALRVSGFRGGSENR
jgi:peptidoglycan/xylan/chitin deacetylase (PgdA/CDA1 family)